MTTMFALCSVIGGTVLLFQLVLSLVGLSHDLESGDSLGHLDHDLGHDPGHGDTGPSDAGPGDAHHEPGSHAVEHSSNWFFSVVSFRSVVAATTFFGLGGLAALSAKLPGEAALLVALGSGLAAMYGVYWLMLNLARLRADGTARVERALGQRGTVYQRVPGRRAGKGKVQLNLQNRTVEYLAVTDQDELPTGSPIVVTSLVSSDVVEVERAT